VLETMKNDSDADVRYFAARALQKGIGSGRYIESAFTISVGLTSHMLG